MPLNVELLRKTARRLRRLRHEEHYNQSVWAEKTACGTAACIAGHMVTAAGYKLVKLRGEEIFECRLSAKQSPRDIQEQAIRLLGWNGKFGVDTSLGYRRFMYALFGGQPRDHWPSPYRDRWENKEKTGERPSRIAADLLDDIADGKVRL